MSLEMIIMDAGQGDATLLVYPDDSLVLVDCGCKKNADVVSDQIDQVLTRYLSKTGNKLKGLVLTHPDGDHYNLVELLIIKKKVIVDTIFYGGKLGDYTGLTSWLSNHTHAISLGQSYSKFDVVTKLSYKVGNQNVDVRILSVNAGDIKSKSEANTNSVVLLVTYKGVCLFLMGDATKDTEKFIISKVGKDLDIHLSGKKVVLKAGHHGSLTSSGKEWITTLKPQVVFISSDTKVFGGASLPRSTVINDIDGWTKLFMFPQYPHHYVQYNDTTYHHEQISTTKGLFTTLHLLKFEKNKTDFTAYGTSWYYRIDNQGSASVLPACGWKDIDTAY